MGNEVVHFFSIWSLWCFGITLSTAPNIDYSHNMRILNLPKTVKPGTLIYRLKGSHPDSIPLTFGVRGPIGRKLLDIKSADFRSADVYLKSSFEETEYNLTIFVTDGNQTTEVDSKIVFTDTDGTIILSPFIDYQPIYFVNENVPYNTTIGFVMAKDKQSSNLPVMFELRGSDNFAIRYVFGPKGLSKAMILLVKEVDYERRNVYPMTIIVTNAWTNETVDTRNVASVDILIVVRDVEDTPPHFVNLPSVVQIFENTEKESIIDTITAEDGDVEINRKIVYSLIKNPFSNYFTINKTSGQLIVKISGLELKNIIGLNNPFILKINATEVIPEEEETEIGLSSSSVASIAFVIVANQNRPPTFATNHLEGYIEENSPVMTAIRWYNYSLPRVNDSDSGLNGTMDLTLTQFSVNHQEIINDITKLFIIQPNWGLREITFSILLGSPFTLDYEKGPNEIKFKVTATDRSPIKPLSSEVIVTINVIDVNDNHPQFTQSIYNVSLYENALPGTKLVQVEATDPDSGIFGQIKYTSINGPIAKNFFLDRDTGLITLKSIEGIDREQTSEYTLTVEARDENGFGLSNVTQLHVTILDDNDNEPSFIQSRYDAVLNPDGLTFTQPLTVKAFDPDEPGTVNSKIVYEIIDGNYQGKFVINNDTGSISISSPLTFDESNRKSRLADEFKSQPSFPTIVLKVRAHDQGVPYRFSTVEVFIHHKDFLNRTVSFIIPQDDSRIWSKKDDIERGLTRLSGADVHIYSIKSFSLGPKSSQIDAWIAYPMHTIVDLRNLFSTVTDLTGTIPIEPKDPVLREPIQTAAVYRNDYELVLWILLILIVVTLLFLVVLLAVWCTCYRNDRKTKTVLESIEPANRIITVKDKSTNHLEQNGSFLQRSKEKRSVHETIVDEAYQIDDESRGDSSRSNEDGTRSADTRKRELINDKQSKFKRIKLGRNRRVRVTPEIIGEAEPIYLEDFTDDPEYYIMRRPKLRRPPLPRHDNGDENGQLRQISTSEPGISYVTSGVDDNFYLFSRRSGSVQRIGNNSSVEFSSRAGIHRGGSLRERNLYPDHLTDHLRSVSEAEIRDLKLEDIEDHNPSSEVRLKIPKESQSDDEYIPRRSAQSSILPSLEVSGPQIRFINDKDHHEIERKSDTKRESNSSSSSSSDSTKSSSNSSEKSQRPVDSKASDLLESLNSTERRLFNRSPSETSNIDMGLVDGVVTRTGTNSALDSQEAIEFPSRSGATNHMGLNGNQNGQLESSSQNYSPLSSPENNTEPKKLTTGVVTVNHNGTTSKSSGHGDNSDHSDKSDSDSGIGGRNRLDKKMNLKNSDLMTKKSIFTIAFDGVKTDRLQSADSLPLTPYV